MWGETMEFTLVGYFPKRKVTRSGWVSPYKEYPGATFPAPMPVEEICSASHCIAGRPEILNNLIRFNEYGGYESPEQAWAEVPNEHLKDYDLFALGIGPFLYRDGKEEPLDFSEMESSGISEQEISEVTENFVLLGYDAVQLDYHTSLGCSPLSCNGQTIGVNLNRYCLVDTENEGIELARRFSIDNPEPGPYCLVEVWREVKKITNQ